MDNNKVQLYEQELVGTQVILKSIYPKTDTVSIEDPTTGGSLDVTLDHIVEMINNRLTRVVNSVNSRTGVVVLDADDVGLGNVDNISFSDIQDWVIDELKKYLASKELIIFDNIYDLGQALKTNDPMYDGRPFYVKEIDNSDEVRNLMGLIGIMRYDPETKELGTNLIGSDLNKDYNIHEVKMNGDLAAHIQDVKDTDKSLTYRKGFMKVNIAKGEDSLYLDEANEGLAIDKDNMLPRIHYYESFYSDYQNPGSCVGPLLSDNFPTNGTIKGYSYNNLPVATITINGAECVNHYKTSVSSNGADFYFRMWPGLVSKKKSAGNTNYSNYNLYDGDLVIIRNLISDEMLRMGRYADDNQTSPSLKFQPTLFGKVTIREDEVVVGSNRVDHVYFNLFTVSQFPSWGLELKQLKTNYKPVNKTTQFGPETIGFGGEKTSDVRVSIAGDYDKKDFDIEEYTKSNYSNLQILSNVDHFNMIPYKPIPDSQGAFPKEQYDRIEPNPTMNKTVSPEGPVNLYSTDNDRRGGLFIPIDMSLCSMPYDQYGISPSQYKAWNDIKEDDVYNNGEIDEDKKANKDKKQLTSVDGKRISNWGIKSPYHFTENDYDHKGYLNPPSFLGINLLKGFITNNNADNKPRHAIPLSGLRVVSNKDSRSSSSDILTWSSFGLYKKVDKDRVLRSYSFQPDPDASPESDSADKVDGSFEDLVRNYISGGLMLNVGKGLEILPTNVPKNANYYDDFGKVNVRMGDAMKFDPYDRIQVNPGHGLKIDDETFEDEEGNEHTEKRLIVDDDVIEATPLLKGIRVEGFYSELYSADKKVANDDFYLDPVALNHERFIECRGSLYLGDGLRWHYTNNDAIEAMLYDMTLYQFESLVVTFFKKKDGSEFQPRDQYKLDYGKTYTDFFNAIVEFATLFGTEQMEFDLYHFMEKTIFDLRFSKPELAYDKSYVQRCVSIYRLLWDEVHNGKDKNGNKVIEEDAKQKTIKELMDNYAKRHRTKVDENMNDIPWTPSDDDPNNDSRIKDYTDMGIMDELTEESQKSLFNYLLNTVMAIKRSMETRGIWFTDRMFSDKDGLEIKVGDKTYVTGANRRGSDTMFNLLFQVMGYDKYVNEEDKKVLNSAMMIESVDILKDGKPADEWYYTFIRSEGSTDNPTDDTDGQLRPMDIVAVRDSNGIGNIMVYTHKDDAGNIYGISFGNTSENFHDTICDLERVIEGAITELQYVGQSVFGADKISLDNVYAVLRYDKEHHSDDSGKEDDEDSSKGETPPSEIPDDEEDTNSSDGGD